MSAPESAGGGFGSECGCSTLLTVGDGSQGVKICPGELGMVVDAFPGSTVIESAGVVTGLLKPATGVNTCGGSKTPYSIVSIVSSTPKTLHAVAHSALR